MKLLIDIGHPGHVHLFRPFASEMIRKKHVILFTCKQKEFEMELLEAAGFDFFCIGKHRTSKAGKLFGILLFEFRLWKIARKFDPDLFFSHGSFYAAHVAAILRKPHIAMEDTGNREQMRLYLPFTQAVLMPDVLQSTCNLENKGIYYRGYHELAYLHPNRFSPDKILDEPYFILRFVAWNATHDVGQGGIIDSIKNEIIQLLEAMGKVYISSEKKLPPQYERYCLPTRPEMLHHVLANATMVVSEGSTTASEAAVLGTPVVYVNSRQVTNTAEEELFGLCYYYKDGTGVIDKIKQLLSNPHWQVTMQNNRERLLANKIDVAAFMVWFIENWPESFKIMEENNDYQLRFK